MATIDTAARCIEYSPDGSLLVIGLGARGVDDPLKKSGAFLILHEEDLSLVHEVLLLILSSN